MEITEISINEENDFLHGIQPILQIIVHTIVCEPISNWKSPTSEKKSKKYKSTDLISKKCRYESSSKKNQIEKRITRKINEAQIII